MNDGDLVINGTTTNNGSIQNIGTLLSNNGTVADSEKISGQPIDGTGSMTHYVTSQDALNDAIANGYKDIMITSGFSIDETIDVPEGTKVSINTGVTVIVKSSGVLAVEDGATLDIKTGATLIVEGMLSGGETFAQGETVVRQQDSTTQEDDDWLAWYQSNKKKSVFGDDDQLIVPFAVGAIAALSVMIVFWIKRD